jgi:hypothetical protein
MKVYWLESAVGLTMKQKIKLSVVAAALLVTGGVLIALLNARAATLPQTYPPAKAAPAVAGENSTPIANNPAVLDKRRQFALGMIETGNDDQEIGGAGEVSRYQIMPSVWQQFSSSRSYQNPDASLEVAQEYWSTLYTRFKQQAHRAPTDFDMYVLWNTRYGYYARRGFDPANLSFAERDRAQRFVNLVEGGDF